MTPNKQLIFETREEAREYWKLEVYPSNPPKEFDGELDSYFTQWLSEERPIIKEEELIMGNLPQTGSIQRLSELKP